jgi:hypothetical protein
MTERTIYDPHVFVGSPDGDPSEPDCLECGLPTDAPVHQTSTCRHCQRTIVFEDGYWVDPEAPTDKDDEGNWLDDAIWRETCDSHDSFVADHEPEEAP